MKAIYIGFTAGWKWKTMQGK